MSHSNHVEIGFFSVLFSPIDVSGAFPSREMECLFCHSNKNFWGKIVSYPVELRNKTTLLGKHLLITHY